MLNLLPWPKDVDRDAGPGFQPLSSDSPAGLHSIASVEAEDDHRNNISRYPCWQRFRWQAQDIHQAGTFKSLNILQLKIVLWRDFSGPGPGLLVVLLLPVLRLLVI